jgi:hypothetical protein
MSNAEWIGMRELKLAIARNPKQTLTFSKRFLQRGLAEYKRSIVNSPWRMGMSGGGAPVSSGGFGGNLRDTHETRIDGLTGSIRPTADYAPYVHGIKGWPRKRSYQLRPWLDHAKKSKQPKIEQLYRELLADITGDLAK